MVKQHKIKDLTITSYEQEIERLKKALEEANVGVYPFKRMHKKDNDIKKEDKVV
jgi:hypothetical protein